MRSFSVCSVIFALIAGVVSPAAAGREYQQAIGLIHMDSEVSGGENSLEMLAAVAKNAGADMAIVTDHDTQKATYGFWPLRKLLRVSHSRACVRRYGVARYLREIHEIDKDLEDFDYMAGIEAVPFYMWDRNTISNSLMLRNIHRHMLVIGLDRPEQVENLPSIEVGYPSRYTAKSLLGLLWFVPLFLSFIMFRPPVWSLYYTHRMGLFSQPLNIIALPLMFVSIVFLVNDFPFKEPITDQYDTNPGVKPYQTLIDYVNAQGGLVFWAHPEATYTQKIDAEQGNPLITFALKSLLRNGLEIVTDPYYELLNDTVDYTGFAIFFEGYKIVGKPGGLWDGILLQFCTGRRERPVWAISEIDMEEGTDPETASESQTVLLVREKTKEEYLEALRLGRVYCFTNNLTHWVTIRDYSVSAGGKRAVSGEILRYEPDARLTFDVEVRKHDLKFVAVFVKDGKILEQREITASERITIPLPPPANDMGYVRVAVYQGGEMRIATNPIFFLR